MEDIHPLKDSLFSPSLFTFWEIVFGGILLLVLLNFIIFFVWKFIWKIYSNRGKSVVVEDLEEEESFLDVKRAYVRLGNTIESREEFYREATFLIKRYLELKLQVGSLTDKSTREVLDLNDISESVRSKLELFLDRADNAKFTGKLHRNAHAEETYECGMDILTSTS